MLRYITPILALPFVMAVIIPALLITQTGTFNPGWRLAFPMYFIPVVTGTVLIGGGLALAGVTINLFGTVGKGTLAPWDPTQHLVITGVYRYVRNPMISGVAAILIGEAILFGSIPLLVWALGFMAVNAVYIPLVEEPGL